MARHKKTGLDWFQHDTDLSNDEKVEALEALYGNNGYAVYLKLLERVYRQAGELKISDTETKQILAKKCNVTLELFNKILESCLSRELFNSEIFSTKKILTSAGIKKRVKPVIKKRLDAAKKYKNKSVAETKQKVKESVAETDIVEKSRVKKSKEENIIIKAIEDLPEIPDWVPNEEFKNWIQMRISSGIKTTMHSIELIIERLKLYAKDGQNLSEVLNRAIEGGWSTLHPITNALNNKQPGGGLDLSEINKTQ